MSKSEIKDIMDFYFWDSLSVANDCNCCEDGRMEYQRMVDDYAKYKCTNCNAVEIRDK